MTWQLVVMVHFHPDFIVKKKMHDLVMLTGRAFEMDPPDTRHCTLDESVELFARFTKKVSDITLRQSPEHQQRVKEKLYHNAYQFGKNMRTLLHIKTVDDVMTAAALLYKMLKIQFQGNRSGEIVIHRCYFSQYYSEKTCRLISALDAGVIAGLSGGGVLTFSQRITQGQSCCTARLDYPGQRT